jgi:hypothetical protein
MRKLFAVLVVAVVFVACKSTGWYRFRGPDNRDDWFALHCTGGQDGCWRKAGTLCLYGYDVYDQSGHEQVRVVASGGQMVGGSQHKGEMVIRCKDAPVEAGAPELAAVDAGQ